MLEGTYYVRIYGSIIRQCLRKNPSGSQGMIGDSLVPRPEEGGGGERAWFQPFAQGDSM